MESKLVKTALVAADTTLVVKSSVVGNADDLSLLSTYPFTLVIEPDTASEEIVSVTARTGGSLTIVRGQDGTTPRDHAVNSVIKHMVTARDLQEPQDHINSTTDVHGISDSTKVVLTTDTGTVATAMVANSAVTTAKIADGNVTTAKIADSNVTTAKVADSAITSAKIANDTIVDADINSAAAIAQSKVSGLVTALSDVNTLITDHTADSTSVHGISNTADLVTKTMLNAALPIGSITMWAVNTAPSDWLVCDGSTFNATTYPLLYTALGNSTTLPDLSGRVPVGKSDDTEFDTMLETGGEKTHLLTGAESGTPIHSHTGTTSSDSHSHTWTYYDAESNTGDGGTSGRRWDNSSDTAESLYTVTTSTDSHSHTISTTTMTEGVDATTAHNNLQPYTVVKFIIKAA